MSQLNSGSSYNLQELFCGNRKIIIPDMQRDYTWGDNVLNGKNNFVSGFCDNLFSLFQDSPQKTIPLGMIYAYPNPENHYHLIDGQQRITTLFLLMGMLYKHTRLLELKERLISDFELKHDDKEPYLQYAIRESTLYFLSDLVEKFFLDSNNRKEVKSIKSELWYFSEYDHDPSIKSMLGALEVIEKTLKDKLDLEKFSIWLIKYITFFYFDMNDREHGEEMFVVINTTGEPLEVTEDLKPLLMGDIPCEQTRKKLSAQWEERETFFWRNKREPTEHTADEGVKDFLTWYIRIKHKTESVDLKKHFKESKKENELKEIHSFFASFQKTLEFIDKTGDDKIGNLKRLFSEDDNGNYTFALSRVRELSVRLNNIFLPFWFFNHKFGDAESFFKEKFLRRLRKNYFHSDKDFSHRKESYVDWRYILQIIEKSNNPDDVLKFDSHLEPINNVKITTWYTVEEKVKNKLRNKSSEISKTLDDWEDHPDFMGDLSILLQAYLLKESNENIPEIIDVEYDSVELSRIMENYKSVIDPLNPKRNCKITDNALFNIFRLFRIFSGIKNIGHIPYTDWGDMRSVSFSDFNRDHLKLKNANFLHVIKSRQPYEFCKQYILQDIKNEESFMPSSFFHAENKWFMPEYFIKIWLTLKIFSAIKDESLLLENDDHGTGIAAYTSSSKNQIISDQNHMEFTLENSICGFAIRKGFGKKSRVDYTKDIKKWDNPCRYIDTPFAGIHITDRTGLAVNKKAIDEIIEFIFQ